MSELKLKLKKTQPLIDSEALKSAQNVSDETPHPESPISWWEQEVEESIEEETLKDDESSTQKNKIKLSQIQWDITQSPQEEKESEACHCDKEASVEAEKTTEIKPEWEMNLDTLPETESVPENTWMSLEWSVPSEDSETQQETQNENDPILLEEVWDIPENTDLKIEEGDEDGTSPRKKIGLGSIKSNSWPVANTNTSDDSSLESNNSLIAEEKEDEQEHIQKQAQNSDSDQPKMFWSYESAFEKNTHNFFERLKNMHATPKTRLGFLTLIIGISVTVIGWLMVLVPEKHSLNIYKTNILYLYHSTLWIEWESPQPLELNQEIQIPETKKNKEIVEGNTQQEVSETEKSVSIEKETIQEEEIQQEEEQDTRKNAKDAILSRKLWVTEGSDSIGKNTQHVAQEQENTQSIIAAKIAARNAKNNEATSNSSETRDEIEQWEIESKRKVKEYILENYRKSKLSE